MRSEGVARHAVVRDAGAVAADERPPLEEELSPPAHDTASRAAHTR